MAPDLLDCRVAALLAMTKKNKRLAVTRKNKRLAIRAVMASAARQSTPLLVIASEARQSRYSGRMDCRVAALLAMTKKNKRLAMTPYPCPPTTRD